MSGRKSVNEKVAVPRSVVEDRLISPLIPLRMMNNFGIAENPIRQQSRDLGQDLLEIAAGSKIRTFRFNRLTSRRIIKTHSFFVMFR